MKKLRFDSGADAVYRSAIAAEAKDADMTSGATQMRWSVGKDSEGFFLEIPESDMELLYESEIEKLEQ